jgi:hypothetical protein
MLHAAARCRHGAADFVRTGGAVGRKCQQRRCRPGGAALAPARRPGCQRCLAGRWPRSARLFHWRLGGGERRFQRESLQVTPAFAASSGSHYDKYAGMSCGLVWKVPDLRPMRKMGTPGAGRICAGRNPEGAVRRSASWSGAAADAPDIDRPGCARVTPATARSSVCCGRQRRRRPAAAEFQPCTWAARRDACHALRASMSDNRRACPPCSQPSVAV